MQNLSCWERSDLQFFSFRGPIEKTPNLRNASERPEFGGVERSRSNQAGQAADSVKQASASVRPNQSQPLPERIEQSHQHTRRYQKNNYWHHTLKQRQHPPTGSARPRISHIFYTKNSEALGGLSKR